jgi:iron complex outermembrane receptor protein
MTRLLRLTRETAVCAACSAALCGISAAFLDTVAAQTVLPPVTIVAPEQRLVRRAAAPKPATSRPRGASTRRAHAPPTAPLPAVASNTAQGSKPTAVIGQPPPAYAGGQVASGQRVGLLGNRSFMNTPFSTTSYTSQYIQDQQARTLGDVLASDPSVRVSLPNTGYADQISVRGFTLFGRDATLDGLAGIVPVRRFPFDSVERVELLRGPAALLVGVPPGASIAGTLNYVPKRATDDPIARWTTGFISNTEFGTALDVGRRYGDHKEWGVRVNGSIRGGDTPLAGQNERVGNGAVGIDYRGERFRFSFDAGYVDQFQKSYSQIIMSIAPGALVPPAPAPTTTLSQPWQYASLQSAYGMARAEYDILENLTAGIGYGHSTTSERSVQTVLSLLKSNGDLTTRTAVLPYWYTNDSADVSLRTKFDTGALTHQVALIGNAVISVQSMNNTNLIGAPGTQNIYRPFDLPAPSEAGIGNGYKTNRFDLTSAAIADVISVWNDRLQVTVGGRQQRIQADSFSPTSGASIASNTSAAFSPAYGVLVKPTREISVYANYIEGLVQGLTAPAGTANANQIFPAALATQREIGAKFDLNGFGAQVALFQIEQQAGATDPVSNLFGLIGQQRNRGAELQLFGQITPLVRLLGGVSLIDGRLTQTPGGLNDGHKAPGVPDVQVTFAPEVDLWFLPGLTATGRVIYTDRVYFDAANLQPVPSWTRFDLGARYKTVIDGRPATFRASVENVLNAGYWQVAGRSLLSLGAPRTYLVSATIDF